MPDDALPRDPAARAKARQARAEEAIRAVTKGANPGGEAFRLSNEFTDEMTGRFSAFVSRLTKKPPRASG